MADNKTTIAIEVEVGGVEPSIESIKDLKNAIKAARDEQVKMASSFGEGSKEYLDASKKLSGLKDRVDDLNDSTQSLKGTGVEQLTQGFAQMKEGIMNLDFDKVKTGFAAMKSGIGAFATSAKTALQGVKGALLATGIGALVVALGVIVAYWDDIKGAIDGVTTAQKKLNEAAAENLAVEQDKLKSLEASDNLLKLQGKSEKEILEIKIAQLDAVYEAQEAQLLMTLQTQIAQVEAEKRNKAILSGMLEWVNKPMELIFSGIDRISKMLGLNLETANIIKKANAEAGTSEDAEKEAARKKELDATIQQLKDLQSKRAGYQIAIKKIDDDAANTKIENQKKADAEKKANDEKALQEQLRIYNEMADRENAMIDAQEAREKKLKDYRLALNKQMLDEKHAQQIAQDEIDGAAMVAKAEKEKALEIKKRDDAFKIAQIGLESTEQLTEMFFMFKKNKAEKGSKEELELAKKQFNVQKAFNLAKVAMDGAMAISNIIATTPKADFGVMTAVLLAGSAIATVTNMAKIASAKFDGGATSAPSAGGGASPMPSIPAPPTIATSANNTNQTTAFDESGKNLNFKQPQINVTATVGVDEIANKTNRVSVLEQQSTF